MLEVKGIHVAYGKNKVLHDVSMEVGSDDLVVVIGSNGAGKTTLMKTIMGLLRPSEGTISYEGQEIQKTKTHQIVPRGLVLVPEGRKIFPKLSVRENLEIGSYSQKYTKAQFQEKLDQCYEIYPRLKERQRQQGGTLSGGEQQMLAISRALMSDPKLLMLDEPSLGLAPIIIDEMFDEIQRINKVLHVPILLVEQNAFSSLEIATKGYVLELGRILKEGSGEELLKDPDIIKAYLGG